jgi:hypothetical protein
MQPGAKISLIDDFVNGIIDDAHQQIQLTYIYLSPEAAYLNRKSASL